MLQSSQKACDGCSMQSAFVLVDGADVICVSLRIYNGDGSGALSSETLSCHCHLQPA